MTVQELIEKKVFHLVCIGEEPQKKITKPFCCDLLSVAMGKAPTGAAWVTVMANMNTLAVAVLTECACVILAEGAVMDAASLEKAKQQGVTLFTTDLPVYEAAVKVAEA